MNAIINRIQDIAIRFKAKIWIESELVELIRETVNVADHEVRKTINSAEVQRELYLHDVGLWRGSEKKWRLVDQQPPDSKQQAITFIRTRADGRICAFCKLCDEPHELLKLATSCSIRCVGVRGFGGRALPSMIADLSKVHGGTC